MDARQLVAVCTELCDNVRGGLLSADSAAEAIVSASQELAIANLRALQQEREVRA